MSTKLELVNRIAELEAKLLKLEASVKPVAKTAKVVAKATKAKVQKVATTRSQALAQWEVAKGITKESKALWSAQYARMYAQAWKKWSAEGKHTSEQNKAFHKQLDKAIRTTLG